MFDFMSMTVFLTSVGVDYLRLVELRSSGEDFLHDFG